jgi:hypothetical protein
MNICLKALVCHFRSYVKIWKLGVPEKLWESPADKISSIEYKYIKHTNSKLLRQKQMLCRLTAFYGLWNVYVFP